MLNQSIRVLTALSLTVILAGCLGGSGGGGSSGTTTNVSIAGVWQGTASPSGYTFDLIVLPNNQFYTVFGTNLGGGLNVLGFDVGTASTSGSQLTGSFTEYNYLGTALTGNLTGTVVANASITGTSSFSNNSTGSFSATPLTNFTYNKAAKVSDVSGSWTGSLLSGALATLTVDAAGNLSGTSGGCSYTGTATPNSSGVNAFDVSVTFGTAPCAAPNQTFTGIAIDYPTISATTQLIVIIKNGANSAGTAFFAQR